MEVAAILVIAALSIAAIVVSIINAGYSGESAEAAKDSAAAAKSSAETADRLNKITQEGQDATYRQWLATHKPWLRVTFPDSYHHRGSVKRDPLIGVHDYKKEDERTHILMRIYNFGHLPCKILDCKFGGRQINGELIDSDTAEDRVAGFLIGAKIAPGEKQLFLVRDLKPITLAHKNQRINLELPFEYAPGISEPFDFDTFAEIDGDITNLVPLESTGDLTKLETLKYVS